MTTTIPHTIQSQIIRECLLEWNVFSLPTNTQGLQYVCKRWFQLISNQPRTIHVTEDNIQPFLNTLERMQGTGTSDPNPPADVKSTKTKGKKDVVAKTKDQQQEDWNLAKNVTYLLWGVDTYDEKKSKVQRICRLLHNCPTITHIKTNHVGLSLFEKNECLPKNLIHFAAEADQESCFVGIDGRLTSVYGQLAKCPSIVSVDISVFSSEGRDPRELEEEFTPFLAKKNKEASGQLTHISYDSEIMEFDHFKTLTKCTDLVSLKLNVYGGASPIDLSLIAKVLTNNPNLTKLSLRMSDRSEGHKALYKAIFAHPSLRSLQINFYYDTEEQVQELIEMISTKNKKITDLGFRGSDDESTVTLLEALSEADNQVVTHLRLGAWNEDIRSSLVKGIPALTKVTLKGLEKDPIKPKPKSKSKANPKAKVPQLRKTQSKKKQVKEESEEEEEDEEDKMGEDDGAEVGSIKKVSHALDKIITTYQLIANASSADNDDDDDETSIITIKYSNKPRILPKEYDMEKHSEFDH
ncbi:hypothetical protein DFA_12316 [Cavenderia fasciculata]|uniref:Uncharacterized protein n=1 Tax=Cavenderia fasciculata TaxID=261658 RepID=F4QD69_CACFS|nr:uncharacterized protein DFA_12316 [Cavenderia fasciculata]EGG14540.1 hypothetical protein DFA_12316 [Cavenderia fasciculata]|eukprot:XP_004366060.1 hypothetical protein DFA_12316 [Cavenderia fasciculata]